jgi:mRNA-degrading endonuclease RelE of RelBE toxin-antitoxin system
VKRIVLSEQAKADIRPIPQQTAMQILSAIHRVAETGAGQVQTLKGQGGEKRLRVGDFRVGFTEESTAARAERARASSPFTPSAIGRKLTSDGLRS